MATYTSHYNLKKPATSDKIRIADFNGNADTIDTTMYDNASLIAQLKSDIGIVENTNTATHNISEGQYVIWKGSLYVASSAISSGATLSTANLTAVSNGGLNALNSKLPISDGVSGTTTGSGNIRTGLKASEYEVTNWRVVNPSTNVPLDDIFAVPIQFTDSGQVYVGFQIKGIASPYNPYANQSVKIIFKKIHV